MTVISGEQGELPGLVTDRRGRPAWGSLHNIILAASYLGAETLGGALSPGEARLLGHARTDLKGSPVERLVLDDLAHVREAIRQGLDPLGEALCAIASSDRRKNSGMF